MTPDSSPYQSSPVLLESHAAPQLAENNRLTYYASFAWDRSGQVTNAQEWDRYLEDFAKRIQAPSEVAVKAQ